MNGSNTDGSDEEKLHIATTFLTCLKSRDWQKMRNILAVNASWTLPGTSILSGKADGADAIVNRAMNIRNFGVMVELIHVVYSFNGVALMLHNTASRGELRLDEHVVIVMELKDKKIAGLTTYLHDVQGINKFFIEGII